MEEQSQQDESRKINKHDFYFETPLYRVFKVADLEKNILGGEVEAYNVVRGFDTTYTINSEKVEDYAWSAYKNVIRATLTCKRVTSDKLIFFLYEINGTIQKIGQNPSLATIQFAEIEKKYKDFLTQEELETFKKAIDLSAQGIGAGSFVYLRRIFERLIWETFNEYQGSLGISEEKFEAMWMIDKVEALKAQLPSQLVAMKSIYSVLSKGVHELSEQECLKYFPALKLSIDLILEQRIEMKIKKERDQAVKEQIAEISERLKQK